MAKSVAIIGGGYYGSSTAYQLSKLQAKYPKEDQLSITLFTIHEYACSLPATVRLITGDFKGSDVTKKYSDFMDEAVDLKIVSKVLEFDDHSVTYILRDSPESVTLEFDIIVLATGLKWYDPVDFSKVEGASLEAFDAYNLKQQQKAELAEKIVIVGGGDVGCELAGELAFKFKDEIANKKKELIVVHSNKLLLDNRILNSVRKSAQNQLEKFNVELVLGKKVDFDKSSDTILTLADGTIIKDVDYLIKSIGPTPNVPKNNLNLVDSKGLVIISDTLQTKKPNIFAAGDVTNLQTKSLMYKDETINVLTHNIQQLLQGGSDFKKYTKLIDETEYKPVIALSLGPEGACGQMKVPYIGTWPLPTFLLKMAKSKTLFTERLDESFV